MACTPSGLRALFLMAIACFSLVAAQNQNFDSSLENDDKKWKPGAIHATLADAYANALRMKAEALKRKSEQQQQTLPTESLPTSSSVPSKSKNFAYTNIKLETSGNVDDNTLATLENALASAAETSRSGSAQAQAQTQTVRSPPRPPLPPIFPTHGSDIFKGIHDDLLNLTKIDLNPFDHGKKKKENYKGLQLGLPLLGGLWGAQQLAQVGGGGGQDQGQDRSTDLARSATTTGSLTQQQQQQKGDIATSPGGVPVPPVNPFINSQQTPDEKLAPIAVTTVVESGSVANETAKFMTKAISPGVESTALDLPTPPPSNLKYLSPSLITRVGSALQPAGEPRSGPQTAAAGMVAQGDLTLVKVPAIPR